MFRLVLFVVPLIFVLAACDEAQEVGEQDLASASTTATASVVPTGTPTSGGSVTGSAGELWRWVDVTLVMPPDKPQLHLTRTFSGLNPPGPILQLTYSDANILSEVWIDAEDGGVVFEDLRDEDKPLFKRVMDTMTLAPLDRSSASWPYKSQLPRDLVRSTHQNVSVIEPAPSTGLQLHGGVGDPNGPFLGLTNGRSWVVFSTDEAQSKGLSFDFSSVLPEDKDVFERWVSEVKICGTDADYGGC